MQSVDKHFKEAVLISIAIYVSLSALAFVALSGSALWQAWLYDYLLDINVGSLAVRNTISTMQVMHKEK